MTREQIELKLQLPILNVCLAAAAGKEGDLREAKNYLIETIEKMLSLAEQEATDLHRTPSAW